MTLAWFDCAAGASGDMFLGALVDAGAPLDVVQTAVDAIGVEPVLLSAAHADRAGVTALKVDVSVPRSDVVRTWGSIRHQIEQASLAEPVRRRALEVFARLALAEAQAHRIRPEQVHFHEVGALDAIADVVGSCAALHALGVTEVAAGPVALGGGVVRSQHGLLPVPGPAVVALLREAGAPVYGGGVTAELCTPTGAALLAASVTAWGDLPPMRLTASGLGAGGRDLSELPNVLRVLIGERSGAPEPPVAVLLETNVDDLDPRLWPAVLAKLLAVGASDAWLTPILMKKGRPAHTLSVLTTPQNAGACRAAVFTETSTLGLRESRVGKHELDRRETSVEVCGRPIRVKTGVLDGAVVNAAPEYDDVAAAAAALAMPQKTVLMAAIAAAQQIPSASIAGADTGAVPNTDARTDPV